MPTFTTTLKQADDVNATGIVVPADVIAELGTSKKPKVVVSINDYTYRSTVAVMGGAFMIPLNQAHRAAAGISGGDTVVVRLELDTEPRTVEVPDDLSKALDAAGLMVKFEALAFSHRKEHVRAINEAKTPETRQRRIEKVVATLTEK